MTVQRSGEQADPFTRQVVVRVAGRIRRRRRAIDLSQESLAELAGIHRTQISLIETGKRLPRLDTLIRLATALDVSPCQLLAGIEWEPGWPLPNFGGMADDA
jgi:transcriptional regulator with XRE-family HTH domain